MPMCKWIFKLCLNYGETNADLVNSNKFCSSDPLAKHDFCHIVNEPLGDYLIILRNFIIFLGTFSFLQTLFLSRTISF
jgi:hypothetical protein